MIRKRNLQTQLNELYHKKAKGAQIKSRAKWINEGEKNTKYFLGLEKKTIKRKKLWTNYRIKNMKI